jgi:hypothetical protein
LSAAAFLFGAMRSYAQITHIAVPSKVEIGGPAALAALVVIGGFWLVPSSPSDFAVTARVRDESGPVSGGTLTLEVGDYTSRPQTISQGMVEFPKVPAKYRNRPARFHTDFDQFTQEKPDEEHVLGKDVPVVYVKKNRSQSKGIIRNSST